MQTHDVLTKICL